MAKSTVSEIKKAQKEALLFREISKLINRIALDDSRIRGIFINRVQLSQDKGHCIIYFYSAEGEAYFNQVLEILKLYKPSIRTAIAKSVHSRYVPDMVFRFDTQYEKQHKLEKLLDIVKEKESESEENLDSGD